MEFPNPFKRKDVQPDADAGILAPEQPLEEESMLEPPISGGSSHQMPASRVERLLPPENQVELFKNMIDPKIEESVDIINRDLVLSKTDEKTRLLIDQFITFSSVLDTYKLPKAAHYFKSKAYIIINALRSDKGFTFEGITSATSIHKFPKEAPKPRGLFGRGK